MKTRPIGDQILVQPFPSDEISEGGIIIPENARARSCKATVMAVGGGTKDRPMRYHPGEIVFHVKDAGTEIIEDGVAYYLMSQVDVLATLMEESRKYRHVSDEMENVRFRVNRNWANDKIDVQSMFADRREFDEKIDYVNLK